MRRLLIASFALLFTALPACAQTEPQAVASLLKQVDAHYNHLSSLRARYVERYHGMGLDRVESGTLLLKKPGRMLWRYDTPPGKVFVLDGKYAWFYTPGDAQAERIPARQMDDLRTPLRFLLGHTELARELTGIHVTPAGPDFLIAGIPRGTENRIRQLSLQVTPAGVIERMAIVEQDGAETSFDFSDQQENVPTPASDFLFTPPPGVTVVDGAPPI